MVATDKIIEQQQKYSVNFSSLDYALELKGVATRFAMQQNKSYTISEFCQTQGILYENSENNIDKHFAMAKYLSETFPELNISGIEDKVCNLFDSLIPREEKECFNFFFHLKLIKLPITEIDDFLLHQLKASFNNEFSSFKRFLSLLMREYKNLINKDVSDSAMEWVTLIQDNKVVSDIYKKIKWGGHPQELINGFNYLIHYSYCSIENVESFVYSNFEFDKFKIPPYENNVFKFKWNSDKHDFTMMLKELKKLKIQSSNFEIKDFIVRTIPEIKQTSVLSYLQGTRKKQKYSIDVSKFSC